MDPNPTQNSSERVPNQSFDEAAVEQEIREKMSRLHEKDVERWSALSKDELFEAFQNNFPYHIQVACETYDMAGVLKPGKNDPQDYLKPMRKTIIETLISLGQDPEKFIDSANYGFVHKNLEVYKKLYIEMRKKGFEGWQLRG